MIYRRGEAFLDTFSLALSIGNPPEAQAPAPPEAPEPVLNAVQAVVTRKCNLFCGYCNVRLSGHGKSTMTRETMERALEAAADAGGGRLFMVTGGEPLLEPEITFELLERAGPPSILFTNGTLIDRSAALRIKAAGASPVVSMDGLAQRHDKYRCGTWSRVAAGLSELRAAEVEFGLSAVVTDENILHLDEDMEVVHGMFRPTGMGFNILHWTREGFHPVSGEEYADAMERVFLKALQLRIFVDQIARRISPLITGRYRHRDCSAMGGKLVFHPDGAVSNCISSRVWEDWRGRMPSSMGQCSNCPAAGICGGGCAWDGIHLGVSGGPDGRHCLWTRRILDLFLEDAAARFPPGPVTREMLQARYRDLITRGASPLGTSIGHRG